MARAVVFKGRAQWFRFKNLSRLHFYSVIDKELLNCLVEKVQANTHLAVLFITDLQS